MSNQKDEVRIFYSWQSDSPAVTNLNAIRGALKTAAKTLKKKYADKNFIIDEAARKTSGAPNIAIKILEKLDQADIVFSDITTVTPKRAKRPCPNPNVSFELGYAVAAVGWDRVILLFNTEFGKFTADLPFDFIQNRASPFKMKEPIDDVAKKTLADLLFNCIDAVVALDPKRPAELKGLSPEKIKYDHDVRQMRWLMATLHLPTIDSLIESLPKSVQQQVFWYLETFRGVASNSLFSLYDKEMLAHVNKFAAAWNDAMKGEFYHANSNETLYIFSNPGDVFLHKREQKAWDQIDEARKIMRKSLNEILDRLRRNYLEVDIDETNKTAWDAYQRFHTD